MKHQRSMLWVAVVMGLAAVPSGCGRGAGDHDQASTEGGHGEESPSGASFKVGKGVLITKETSAIIGLEIADVTEELLPQTVQLNVQIFTETHRLQDLKVDHTGCQFHGSGFLPLEKTALLTPKQPVTFTTARGETLDGFVVAVQQPLTHGEAEVIVGVTTPNTDLKDGEFLNATVAVPRSKPVTAIPRSALLRTIEGTYVYAVNGDAYYRTAVTVGGSADDKLEVTDGLYPGDQVVAKPVETLWLIELRATKGGGHSH